MRWKKRVGHAKKSPHFYKGFFLNIPYSLGLFG